jgi:hypothetical protein
MQLQILSSNKPVMRSASDPRSTEGKHTRATKMIQFSYLEIAQASENVSRELLKSVVCNGNLL